MLSSLWGHVTSSKPLGTRARLAFLLIWPLVARCGGGPPAAPQLQRPEPSQGTSTPGQILTNASCTGTIDAGGAPRIPGDAVDPAAWIPPAEAIITKAVLLPPNQKGERHVQVAGWVRAPADPRARGVIQFGMSDAQGTTHGEEAVRAADQNCIVWHGTGEQVEWTLTTNRAWPPYLTMNPARKFYTIKTANKLGPANAPDVARKYFQNSIDLTDGSR